MHPYLLICIIYYIYLISHIFQYNILGYYTGIIHVGTCIDIMNH